MLFLPALAFAKTEARNGGSFNINDLGKYLVNQLILILKLQDFCLSVRLSVFLCVCMFVRRISLTTEPIWFS